MIFKDKYREIQEIVRELTKIRAHNQQFKEGDPQDNLFMFAEASLCFLALERFLRILPDLNATEQDTLRNLLERATSRRLGLLQFLDLNSNQPITDEQRRQQVIDEVTAVRNTLQHGNYEQAAVQAGVESVAEYFRTQFASEIETTFQIISRLFNQIDSNTGRRKK